MNFCAGASLRHAEMRVRNAPHVPVLCLRYGTSLTKRKRAPPATLTSEGSPENSDNQGSKVLEMMDGLNSI